MFTGLAERFGDEAPRIMDVGDQVDGAEDRAKITRNNVSEEAIWCLAPPSGMMS